MNKSSKQKPPKSAPPTKPQTAKTETGKPTGSKTGKSESYHKGKDGHGGHSSHTEVGVGVDIDLSGIGQRRLEPNPFAVSGPPAPRTQARTEKPKTKEKQHEITTPNPFANVALTGPEAKEESEPPGTINVADNQDQTTESPPPATQEKPKEKKKKPKPTWPKNIQDWLDLKLAASLAAGKYANASEAYRQALYAFYEKSQHLKDLKQKEREACDKAKAPDATQADKDACEKARREVAKQKSALNQDFDNTPEGKQLLNNEKAALEASKQAKQAAENAAKDIDKATQDKVEKKMKKWVAENWKGD
jgi:Arc/MetJ-type ribon-helix-helix transcriptional regulator